MNMPQTHKEVGGGKEGFLWQRPERRKGLYSKMFSVPKLSGRWRLITDLRRRMLDNGIPHQVAKILLRNFEGILFISVTSGPLKMDRLSNNRETHNKDQEFRRSSLQRDGKLVKTGFSLAVVRIRTIEWSLLTSTKKGSIDEMYVTQQNKAELECQRNCLNNCRGTSKIHYRNEHG